MAVNRVSQVEQDWTRQGNSDVWILLETKGDSKELLTRRKSINSTWLREDTGSTIGRKRENHRVGKPKGNDQRG